MGSKRSSLNTFTTFVFRTTTVLALLAIGCAPARFEKSSNPRCLSDTGICDIDETLFVSGGKVDILFVDDNSGSMSFEQTKIGERFNNLLTQLDERILDYRIAITTTDISSVSNPARAINKNGALQDGRLVPFGNGEAFLEGNTPNKQSLFLSAIQRPETLECENYITTSMTAGLSITSTEYQQGYYQHCPSGDERGVVAALNVAKNNPSSFFRPKSHLALIIISDENERSWGTTDATNPYALQPEDDPKNLIDTITSKYPQQTLTAHAIVVRSGDTSCLQMQNSQTNGVVKGQYGTVYEALANATNGVIGSVCESDYSQQMGRIGAAIVKQVQTLGLHCEQPQNFQVTFDPVSATAGHVVKGKKVVFDRILDPSVKVRFRYHCPIAE